MDAVRVDFVASAAASGGAAGGVAVDMAGDGFELSASELTVRIPSRLWMASAIESGKSRMLDR